MEEFTEFLLGLAASPVAYIILATLLVIDGFFPLVPGESLVVALAVLAAHGGGPNLTLVIVVAILATAAGDTVAYLIGRRVGIGRWRWMRRPRVAASFAWAARSFDRRPATLILTGRFVPLARVAVMMTAGVTGFRAPRFVPLAVVASAAYTLYHALIGFAAGSWLRDNPILAVIVALAAMVALGLLLDLVIRSVGRRARRREAQKRARLVPGQATPPM